MRGAEIRVEVSHGQLTVIKVSGEIDLSNVGSFRSAIAGVLPSCALGFVIDLTTTKIHRQHRDRSHLPRPPRVG